MFSVAEFSELSPLQKFSLCIFALLLQDLELKLSQNWFCDVTTLWSTAARIELSCTVLYMIWSCDSYLFYWNKIEVLQQNSQSSQQCQCGWMCGSWLQPACTVNKLQNHKKMDSNLAFWAFPWNLAINYKQNENNYRLYTNPYCTDFIVEGTWENVSHHQLSTEVP